MGKSKGVFTDIREQEIQQESQDEQIEKLNNLL
jgi:hypothetical protein